MVITFIKLVFNFCALKFKYMQVDIVPITLKFVLPTHTIFEDFMAKSLIHDN